MRKILSIIIFVVLAAGIVAVALWYNTKSDEAMRAAEVQAGAAAEQTQSAIMQNFKINDVTVGTGAEAKNGDSVTVNYVGTLDDGTKFDSSYDRNQPFTFVLGAGKVIKGWDLGVVGMKVGGKRELTIPPELGYGASGVPQANIPPNATLHFTVELLSVNGVPSSTSAGQ
ncbi:MAG: FKBP-type peptidyl-prolyl cis-trans isomerase [Minisyncoccia bacterium]|jgi:FKBP-type peptidyl-prolyl cis-trans isomerase